MNQRSHLTLVQVDDLPPPMLPEDVDLKGMDAVLVEREWLTSVENRIEMGPEAMVAALTLQQASIDQKPSGSLPANDTKLGYLALYGSHTAGWLAVKDRALKDWVLCSDNRYYCPTICIRILDSWIKCINSREKSDAGNSAKNKVEFDPTLYVKARARAEAALAQLAPFAPILRKSKAKSRAAVATGTVVSPTGSPTGTPPSSPCRTPNGTERNGTDSSSLLCRDDSSDRQNEPSFEVEKEGGSAKRTIRTGPISPWPPGWFEIFRSRYPKRDTGQAWGRAEKALDRIRRAGKVPFEDILDGIDWMLGRLASGHLKSQYTPLASTWLNDRGWEDRLAPKTSHPTPPADFPPSPRVGAEPSITQRAAMRAAERLGLLDEPRPRG